MLFKLNIQLFGGAHDSEDRRRQMEAYRYTKKGLVENPWYRYNNKVSKYVSKSEANAIKSSSSYKSHRTSVNMANIERGGSGAEGDLSDPYGKYDSRNTTGDTSNLGFDMGFMDDLYGSPVSPSRVDAPSFDNSFGGGSYQSSGGGRDYDTKFSSLGTAEQIQHGIDTTLDFSTPMMKNLESMGFSTAEGFGQQFSDIGSYASFQESVGQMGFDSLGMDAISDMTSGQAQDYIDEMSGKMAQRFDALSKTSLIDNVSKLQDMVTTMNLRTVETYDPTKSTFSERMTFNSAVRDLQTTGETSDLKEDVRMSDLTSLALGTASLMTGNPMGLVSSAYSVSKLTDMSRLSPMGQLAQYGKFTDPSLSRLNLSRSEISKLGSLQGEIQDFAQTVETAQQNVELDKRIQSFNRKSNQAETRQGAIIQNVEAVEKEQEASIENPTSEVQGSARITKRGNLGFSRDVSNKGLGDVVSVFGQIDAPNEDEIIDDNVGYRFSLANLFGRF